MRRASTTPTVQLFPFLAVLVCAMGALILLLLVTTRKLRQVAVARALAVESKQVSVPISEEAIDPLTPPLLEMPIVSNALPVDEPAPAVVEEHISPPNVEPSVEELANQRQKNEELRAQREAELQQRKSANQMARQRQLRREIAWRAQLNELQQQRDQRQSELQESSQRLTQLRQSLELTESNLQDLAKKQSAATLSTEETQRIQADLERQVAELTTQIKNAQTHLEELRQARANEASRFAIVPYDGALGTTRRPIFIECSAAGIRFQPEGQLLEESDLKGFTESFNPLLSGCRALVEYWKKHPDAEQSRRADPYVLLIVRPNGSVSYYVARKMLSQLSVDFGYELVENDFPMAYPPVQPEAQRVVQTAIAEALRERGQLLAENVDMNESRIQNSPILSDREPIEFGSLKEETLVQEAREHNPFVKNSVGVGKDFTITRTPVSTDRKPGIHGHSGVVSERRPPLATSKPRTAGVTRNQSAPGFGESSRPATNEQSAASRSSVGIDRSSSQVPRQVPTAPKHPPLRDPFGRETITSGRTTPPPAPEPEEHAAQTTVASSGRSTNQSGFSEVPTGSRNGGPQTGRTTPRTIAQAPNSPTGLLAGDKISKESHESSTSNEGAGNGMTEVQDIKSPRNDQVGENSRQGEFGESRPDTQSGSTPSPRGTKVPRVIDIQSETAPESVFGETDSQSAPRTERVQTQSEEDLRGIDGPSHAGSARSRTDSLRQIPADDANRSQPPNLSQEESIRTGRRNLNPLDDLSNFKKPERTDEGSREGNTANSSGLGNGSSRPAQRELNEVRKRAYGEQPDPKAKTSSAKVTVAEKREVAKRRWGGSNSGQIGFERQVRMQVYPDRILMGDSQIELPIGPDLKQDELVESVLEGLDDLSQTWGRPPSRFYWVPYLKFEVYPKAEQQYERLHGPLRDWGLFSEVTFQDKSQSPLSADSTVTKKSRDAGKEVKPASAPKRSFFDWLRGRPAPKSADTANGNPKISEISSIRPAARTELRRPITIEN